MLAGQVSGVVAGCAPSNDERVQVYAASSLTDVFRDVERAFEDAHEGADLALNFGGSQVLRLQIEQGAPADVFATADPAHIRSLMTSGRAAEGRTFAHGELVIIVPEDGAANVASLEDLRNARRLVIGTEYVPVGRYTREVLRRASREFGADFEGEVLGRVVSEENNVRLVRAKVELGEADAAIVYASDVRTGSGVRVIPIPEAVNVRADYCIAAIDGATNAAPFIEFLGSPAGEAIFERHGFEVDRAAP